MKDLFLMLLDLYLITLIVGAAAAVLRFWLDVIRFHPREIKETRVEFENDIEAVAADQSEVRERSDENGRDEYNSSALS